MAITNAMVVQIENGGISEVTELLDFDKDTLQKIAENICCLGWRVSDLNYINPVPFPVTPLPVPTILTPTFIFGAKSQKCLMISVQVTNCPMVLGSL